MSILTDIQSLRFRLKTIDEQRATVFALNTGSLSGDLIVSGNTILGDSLTDVVSLVGQTTASYLNVTNNTFSTNITGTAISSSNFIGNGTNIWRRYGVFCDTTTQTASAINTELKMYYNMVEEANGVSIVSGSQIKVEHSGTYNIQFSVQLLKSTGGSDEISIWLKKNNNNIPRTNTNVLLTGNGARNVAAWNHMLSLNANDYIELAWSTPVGDVELHYVTSSIGPVRPEIPSVILSIHQV